MTQVWRKDEKEKNEWGDSIGMWKNGYNQNFGNLTKQPKGAKLWATKQMAILANRQVQETRVKSQTNANQTLPSQIGRDNKY